jgi:hypothetical protein
MAGRNIAILLPPGGTTGLIESGLPPKCIVANPRNGNVISVTDMKLHVTPAPDFATGEVAQLWRRLGSDNLTEADDATMRLISGQDKAIPPLMQKMLGPTTQPAANQVSQWISDLGDPNPQTRDQATSKLIDLGEAASAAGNLISELKSALNTDLSPEAKTRIELVLKDITSKANGDNQSIASAQRESRAVRILSEIATPVAIEKLIDLSAINSSVAKDARAALRRI